MLTKIKIAVVSALMLGAAILPIRAATTRYAEIRATVQPNTTSYGVFLGSSTVNILNMSTATVRNKLSVTGPTTITGRTTITGTSLDVGTAGTAGALDVYPPGASSGVLGLRATSNSAGISTYISNEPATVTSTVSVPAIGANTTFLVTGGTQTITGTLTISSATASHFAIHGVTDGSTALAGDVGEAMLQTRARGSFSYSNGNTVSIATITLTSGDWDISGGCLFDPSGTTVVTTVICALSKTNDTVPSGTPYALPSSGQTVYIDGFPAGYTPSNSMTRVIPPMRVSVTGGTQTYYVVGQANFSASTLTGGGHIRARRIR